MRNQSNAIAIVVGHHQRDKGAAAYNSTSEWAFNGAVARILESLLLADGVTARVFTHNPTINGYKSKMIDTANRIREWENETKRPVGLALELHFNAASPSAHGYEYLHWWRSTKGKAWAKHFSKIHEVLHPKQKNRGAKARFTHNPVSHLNRGGWFLRLTHCPAIIAEPFFGTNEAEASRFIDSPERVARIYHRAISIKPA